MAAAEVSVAEFQSEPATEEVAEESAAETVVGAVVAVENADCSMAEQSRR